MEAEMKLHKPWLVAVWPGMGNVALGAGYYMMAKLRMQLFAEFSSRELFEIEHVDVEHGLIRPGHLPRSRLFLWSDPQQEHDVIVFIGEAQPASGKYAFCQNLVTLAKKMGVERLFTFAAMGTQMRPEHVSQVFGATTDEAGLEQLKASEIELLEEGQISGLNGVLLSVAAEAGLQGTCLLGEMPFVFSQLPFPKASLAILRVFSTLAGIDLDTHELVEQARVMDQNLQQLLTKVEEAIEQRQADTEEFPESDSASEENGDSLDEVDSETEATAEEPVLSNDDESHIESLFKEAHEDRSKAYELKRELDRLQVFQEYEDRFLNLFRKSQAG